MQGLKLFSTLPDLKGKKVLLRSSLNVPVTDGKIESDFRLIKSLKTIEFLQKAGARLIIISHIEDGPVDSLRIVLDWLKERMPVSFQESYANGEADKIINDLKDGDIVLFENLRKDPREKKNDDSFAEMLAHYGDIYINDDFAASHRKHASIDAIKKFIPSYSGLLFEEEVKHLSLAFNPPHPFTFILGGAKFETKLPLIKKFLKIADTVFIGGALAHPIWLLRGFEIGHSVMPEVSVVEAAKEVAFDKKIILPTDVWVIDGNGTKTMKSIQDVSSGDKIMDCGMETIELLREKLKGDEFILWNGPLGDYEKGFGQSTRELAHIIADLSAQSIVGGGDTVALITQEKIEDRFTFVSTGGGAMLDFLAK